jgi:hypothetical protein
MQQKKCANVDVSDTCDSLFEMKAEETTQQKERVIITASQLEAAFSKLLKEVGNDKFLVRITLHDSA